MRTQRFSEGHADEVALSGRRRHRSIPLVPHKEDDVPGKRQGPLLQLACTNISSRRFPSPPALTSNTTYLSYHSMSHLLASRTPTDTRRSPGSQPAHAVLDPESTEPSGTSPAPFNRDEDELLSRDPGGVDQGHPRRGPKSQEKEGRIPLQRPGEFDVALFIAGRCHSLTSPQLAASISLHAFPGHQNRQADAWIQSRSPVGEEFSRTIDGGLDPDGSRAVVCWKKVGVNRQGNKETRRKETRRWGDGERGDGRCCSRYRACFPPCHRL